MFEVYLHLCWLRNVVMADVLTLDPPNYSDPTTAQKCHFHPTRASHHHHNFPSSKLSTWRPQTPKPWLMRHLLKSTFKTKTTTLSPPPTKSSLTLPSRSAAAFLSSSTQ